MARDPNSEIRSQYEIEMGRELGSVFAELWQELTWLHHVWQEYRVIFATSPEQLDVFNKAAGGFFFTVQKVMCEAIVLHLARLVDPPRSVGKPNLTMTRLRELVRKDLQEELVNY